nr:MAG TPA: hypothetical protein [Caudoviricetes sp.]
MIFQSSFFIVLKFLIINLCILEKYFLYNCY